MGIVIGTYDPVEDREWAEAAPLIRASIFAALGITEADVPALLDRVSANMLASLKAGTPGVVL